MVFDESHFGKFTAHYQRGSYVFDIHPPLGKMSFAFFGWLIGYDQKYCEYEEIGDVYADNCEYWKLRSISATFGSVVSVGWIDVDANGRVTVTTCTTNCSKS